MSLKHLSEHIKEWTWCFITVCLNGVLTPLSEIFQQYHGIYFNWGRKLEYPSNYYRSLWYKYLSSIVSTVYHSPNYLHHNIFNYMYFIGKFDCLNVIFCHFHPFSNDIRASSFLIGEESEEPGETLKLNYFKHNNFFEICMMGVYVEQITLL